MPFQLSHPRRVANVLSVDIDNDGKTVIDIQSDDHIMTFKLSDREVRALIRELRMHLPHTREGR